MIATDLLPTFSLVFSFLVVAIAGIFTVRSNVATTWRENFEAERELRLKSEAEAKEQREQKHNALNELAAMKMRTDITPLVKFATEIRDNIEQHRTEDLARIEAHIDAVLHAIEKRDSES